jgi:hypothetical protein
MNSKLEYNAWMTTLSNLGSRVSPRSNKTIWIDLEKFIVLGAKYATEDSRLFTSYIIICLNIAPILSPFKIKKIALKFLQDDEFNIFGFIISKIQNNVRNQTQWNGLISMCNKRKSKDDEIILFNSRAFKIDNDFKEWNINSSKLEFEDQEKYVNIKKLFNHDLIKQRLSGVKTVYADINFYRQFFGETSLNKMAKDIFHDYNTVYQANELMRLAAF